MMLKTILWDFNGTLLDDVNISLSAVNDLRRILYNYKGLSLDEYRQIFTFPVSDYYLKAGFDFQRHSFEKVGKMWVELYESRFFNTALRRDIEVILKKYRFYFDFVILTASKSEKVLKQLEELKIRHYFKDVIGNDDIYAYGKYARAHAYLKDKDRSEYLLIGDTLHDLEIGQRLGVETLLLKGGHQDEERLLKSGAKVFADADAIMAFIMSEKSLQ